MKVSIEQVRKVVEQVRTQHPELKATPILDSDPASSQDSQLIRQVVDEVMKMPEVREELVAELKARIERGEYNPNSQDIVEAMVRRAIADKIR
jgi:flagellar biosynthesis anti-sigma factor FlgM